MALKHDVVENTEEHVRIVYVDRHAAKFWNRRRGPDDTQAFCGWFWIRRGVRTPAAGGRQEGGPFPTKSAALRDAYYRFVLRRDLPGLGGYAGQSPANEPNDQNEITSFSAPGAHT